MGAVGVVRRAQEYVGKREAGMQREKKLLSFCASAAVGGSTEKPFPL